MNRRQFLATTTTGAAAGLAGCTGGEVVLDIQESVRISPHTDWWVREITDVEGNGQLSYDVTSRDKRFQVFYFTDGEQYNAYRSYMQGEDLDDQPEGDRQLSRTAIEDDDRDRYVARFPEDGGRHSMDFDGSHYFVVDHSNYGTGPQVEDHAQPLQVSVSLQVVDSYLPW